MSIKTSVIGFPRIGKNRELKFASEKFFTGPRHDAPGDGGTDCRERERILCAAGADLSDFGFLRLSIDFFGFFAIIKKIVF